MEKELNNRKVIVVLGMHRSGTSVVTRSLQVMGVDLGDRLMPAHKDVNPKGFWEDLDFYHLDNEILEALDCDWCYLRPIRKKDLKILHEDGFYLRAKNLLYQKMEKYSVFGIKEPRITKLLPFWKDVFESSGFDVRYIITLRNPMSVAKSLEKRDELCHEKSYLIWLEHVVNSLTESAGSKRTLVNYELLISNPRIEIEKIAAMLELSIDPHEFENYRSEFLDDELRHGRYELGDLIKNKNAPELVKEVYEVLSDVINKKKNLEDQDLKRNIEAWRRRMDDMYSALILADRYYDNYKALHFEKSEINENIEYLKQKLKAQEKQVGCMSRILYEREKQIEELDKELTQRGKWALGLEKELQENRIKLDSVYKSKSWKITMPFRETVRWLNDPSAQARRYLSYTAQKGKDFYSFLPFDYNTKTKHRRWLSKYFPWVLNFTSTNILGDSPHAHLECRPEFDADNYLGGIALKTSDCPVVSVIIPVYGNCGCTLRCLSSIADHSPENDFEVIVVDDCSIDNTDRVLKMVDGIRIISNASNQGFIRSCNIGAKAAKGQYLYFLNNDTEVMEGWLDELVNTFDVFPGTGLVGSKLVYPDGTLQEAGGIIWQDGSAWNFGRHQDPAQPVYNYAREVDYCSGASIMLLKTLFDELGGFDEYYLPAYCEDSDIALKIREKGYRVLYQSLSSVVHHEGLTSGKNTKKGVKAYQVENSSKLFMRWQNRLKSHQPNGVKVGDAKDRYAKKRVLVIDHCTPTPNQDAGSVTVFNFLMILREMKFQVTFIPEDNFLYLADYTTALQRVGIEVLYAPYVTTVVQHLKESGLRYDLAFLFRPGVVERHLDNIRSYCPDAKVLYHTIDLHFLRIQREADLHNDENKKKKSVEMKNREYSLIRAVDATIVHSTKEMEMLRPDMPNQNITVLPLIMEVCGTKQGFEGRNDILFIGGYQHIPNVDAVIYFVSEIMPILRQRLPGVRFYAVGSKPPAEILSLASEDVKITGFVEDLRPLLEKVRLSVAPLRYGAGIKGKIGMTMSYGLPTVATTIAVEGMSLSDGKNIIIADGAKDFASAIVRLYQDAKLWQLLSKESVKFVEKKYGSEAAWNTFAGILKTLQIDVERDRRILRLYSPKMDNNRKRANI